MQCSRLPLIYLYDGQTKLVTGVVVEQHVHFSRFKCLAHSIVQDSTVKGSVDYNVFLDA